MNTSKFGAIVGLVLCGVVSPSIVHAAKEPRTTKAAKPAKDTAPAATPATPGATPATPSGPVGTLDIKETIHDAGTVEKGAKVVHAFELKNVGTGILTVEAKPGCGCTVVDYDKTIAPGATGKITSSVDTTNFKGPITKSITITTNDPEHPTTILQMKANVRVPVNVEPDVVSMDGTPGQIEPKEVMITATEGETFDIVSVDSSDPHFKTTIVPVIEAEAGKPAPKAPKAKTGTVASGSKAYKLTVTLAKDAPIARTNATITLKTTHPKAADLPIRVFANLRGNITVTPERLTFRLGPTAPETAKVQHVVIRKNNEEGKPLELSGVTSSVPAIKTTLKTTRAGQEYDLEVKFDGPTPTSVATEKVTVKTNDPLQPSVEILVYAMPEPASQQGVQITPTTPGSPVTIAKPAGAPARPKPVR